MLKRRACENCRHAKATSDGEYTRVLTHPGFFELQKGRHVSRGVSVKCGTSWVLSVSFVRTGIIAADKSKTFDEIEASPQEEADEVG